jgi:hypothetical protein
MCLYSSFGDIQILGDLRVVASLKKELDNLLFSGSAWADILIHKCCPSPGVRPTKIFNLGPSNAPDRVVAHSFCMHAAKIATFWYLAVEKWIFTAFSCKSLKISPP